jgi:hypothetical protein
MRHDNLKASIQDLQLSQSEFLALFCASEYPLGLLCMIEKIIAWGKTYGNDWRVSKNDAIKTLDTLLHRDILTVIDSRRQIQILEYIANRKLEGPFCFYPEIGAFEFTQKGGEIWLELSSKQPLQKDRAVAVFSHPIDSTHIAVVGMTERGVLDYIPNAIPSDVDTVFTSSPEKLAAWCTRWWDQYPHGFIVTLTVQNK